MVSLLLQERDKWRRISSTSYYLQKFGNQVRGQETVRKQLCCALLKGWERKQALSDLNEELLQHSCCSIKSLLKELHKELLQKTKTGSMPENLSFPKKMVFL